jgi:hypothetical protein
MVVLPPGEPAWYLSQATLKPSALSSHWRD